MTSSGGWSAARRIGFRFGIVFGGLVIYPFPIGTIYKTDDLETLLRKPLDWGVAWLARSVLGLPDPRGPFTGSGDRTFNYVQLLLIAILAVLGTIAWSILDRRRRSYPRLAAGAHVTLRYVLASAMLSYGFSKILRMQFSDLMPGRLNERVGEMSPMGLLWTFMDYSTAYTVFAGLAEAVGGALLLWRRTATIGALLLVPVTANVVILNFCYDVPVKLYSTELLIMAIAIAAPSLRRLIGAALGRATAEVPPRARLSPRRERARWIAALAMTAMIAGSLYLEFAGRPNRADHVHELYGTWTVDTFAADGVERPPLATDADRWRLCLLTGRYLSVLAMAPVKPQSFPIEVDAGAGTITPTVDRETRRTETWKYTRPDPDHLVIDAVHGGVLLHVALHREPDPLLVTRGFHWINEVPFNR